MRVPAANHLVDTIVGGLSAGIGPNPWARKSAHGPEKASTAVFSDPEQPWLRTVLREIGTLADLQENWDGYGAGPIRTDVLWYAVRLLQSVMDDYPAPQMTPMSHEGVLLEWVRDSVRLEIEIENAGKAYISYENEEANIDDAWEVKADFASLEEPLRAIAGRTSAASGFNS